MWEYRSSRRHRTDQSRSVTSEYMSAAYRSFVQMYNWTYSTSNENEEQIPTKNFDNTKLHAWCSRLLYSSVACTTMRFIPLRKHKHTIVYHDFVHLLWLWKFVRTIFTHKRQMPMHKSNQDGKTQSTHRNTDAIALEGMPFSAVRLYTEFESNVHRQCL